MKLVLVISLSLLLGFSINFTYKSMLGGMNPFVLKVVIALNILLLSVIGYLIYLEKKPLLKIFEIAILIILIGISIFITKHWVEEIKSSYKNNYFPKTHLPICTFYLEEYEEAHADIDYFPDLSKSDSTSFEIKNWTAIEVKEMLSELKLFENNYQCNSSIEKYSLENFLKSSFFKAEIRTTYYPKSISNKNIIIYWDKGHTIVSYGFEPK